MLDPAGPGTVPSTLPSVTRRRRRRWGPPSRPWPRRWAAGDNHVGAVLRGRSNPSNTSSSRPGAAGPTAAGRAQSPAHRRPGRRCTTEDWIEVTLPRIATTSPGSGPGPREIRSAMATPSRPSASTSGPLTRRMRPELASSSWEVSPASTRAPDPGSPGPGRPRHPPRRRPPPLPASPTRPPARCRGSPPRRRAANAGAASARPFGRLLEQPRTAARRPTKRVVRGALSGEHHALASRWTRDRSADSRMTRPPRPAPAPPAARRRVDGVLGAALARRPRRRPREPGPGPSPGQQRCATAPRRCASLPGARSLRHHDREGRCDTAGGRAERLPPPR